MLKNMPEGMQQIMDRSLRQAMHEGIPKAMQKQEQDRKTSIEVHYYHCDHLGTPLALTDREGDIAGGCCQPKHDGAGVVTGSYLRQQIRHCAGFSMAPVQLEYVRWFRKTYKQRTWVSPR